MTTTEIRTLDDYYKLLVDVVVPERARIIAEDPAREGQADVVAFAEHALSVLESEAWTSDPQQVFFRKRLGKPAREVALPVYSIMEEEGALHLFAFIYDPSSSTPKPLEQKAIERQRTGLEGLVEVLRDPKFDPTSLDDPAAGNLAELRQFLLSDRCHVIKYFVITNQLKSERSKPERGVDGKVFKEVVDIDRLFKWARGIASRSEIEVSVADYLGTEKLMALRTPQTTDAVTTFVSVMPGRFLAELYENFDNRLLELNVRSYLSAKGGVNKGIQDTLKDPEKRSLFLPYNNGIVMTVEELNVVEVGSGAAEIKWMKGIQIVNGGQTTASLFKARRDIKGDVLAGVYVQAKIIKIAQPGTANELVKNISKYANSQNKVEMADLGANEAFHRRLERLAEKEIDPVDQKHWFYERMRNAYATQLMLESSASARKKWQTLHPKERVIEKTELAKAMLAWDRQPWVVAKGGQKCFHAFAQSHHVKPIQTDEAAELELTADRFKEIVGKVILYKTAHSIVRGDREAFPGNQNNVATYTVAYLSRRVAGELDWKAIWRKQGLSDEMQAVIKAWARRVDAFIQSTAGGKKLLTEVCKKEPLFDEMTRHLDDLPLPETEAGTVEPIEMKGRINCGDDILDEDEQQTIAELMGMSPERLAGISRVAEQNTGVLSDHQRGVLANVAVLAQTGWPKRPKAKQAKMFLNAMAKLESYGLVDAA